MSEEEKGQGKKSAEKRGKSKTKRGKKTSGRKRKGSKKTKNSSFSKLLKKAFCCSTKADSDSTKKIRKHKTLTKSKKEKDEKSRRARIRKPPILKNKIPTKEDEKRRKMLKKKFLKARAETPPKKLVDPKPPQLPCPPPFPEPWLITQLAPKEPTPPPSSALPSSRSETDVAMPSPKKKIKKTKKLVKTVFDDKRPMIDYGPPEQSLQAQFFRVFGLPAMRWDYTDSRPNSLLAERPKIEDILRHVAGEHPDTIMDFGEMNAPCRCWKCRIQKSMSTLDDS